MDSLNYQQIVTLKTLDLAKKILNSEINLTEGGRSLFSLLCEKDLNHHEDFLIFTAFDDETEVFPMGPQREYWNKESLKLKDQERSKVEKHYQEDVFEGCNSLL